MKTCPKAEEVEIVKHLRLGLLGVCGKDSVTFYFFLLSLVIKTVACLWFGNQIKGHDRQAVRQQSDPVRVPFFLLSYGTLK